MRGVGSLYAHNVQMSEADLCSSCDDASQSCQSPAGQIVSEPAGQIVPDCSPQPLLRVTWSSSPMPGARLSRDTSVSSLCCSRELHDRTSHAVTAPNMLTRTDTRLTRSHVAGMRRPMIRISNRQDDDSNKGVAWRGCTMTRCGAIQTLLCGAHR